MDSVAGHQSTAAGRLYRVIAEDEDNNIFLSPFSISTAMTMVAAGADGDTAIQIQNALALPGDMTTLHDQYHEVLKKLQNPPNVTLSMANKLYAQDSYQILESYTDLLKKQYCSELKTVDFGDGAGTSELINGDVMTETKGKIKDLIKPSDLDEYDRLVLVNAIYFKGSWRQKFDTRGTHVQDFFVTPGKVMKTQMMNMSGKKFNCGNIPQLGCKALEMPYEGDRFSMIMLLPDKQDGLKEMEGQLPSSPGKYIRGGLSNREAVISVPKFKLETSYDLIRPLYKLGINDLFFQNADLSNISKHEEVYVSKMLHKAFIEVNEEGAETEADQSSGLATGTKCTPFEFVADHPFFFVIFDRETGLTLFSGRYVKPV